MEGERMHAVIICLPLKNLRSIRCLYIPQTAVHCGPFNCCDLCSENNTTTNNNENNIMVFLHHNCWTKAESKYYESTLSVSKMIKAIDWWWIVCQRVSDAAPIACV